MNAKRVADRDREAVVVRLGVAAGEGRLTLTEFDDRAGRAYLARTYNELDVLVADLPTLARDHRGLILSLLALTGGVGWMPLFPYLDHGALPAVAGVVFGVLGIRANPRGQRRALAMLGLVGGSVGIALQVAWLVVQAVR